VYDILEKQAEGDLKDRPRTPNHQPNKTPDAIEEQVVKAKNQTRLGPKRLSLYLQKYEGITVPAGTIRHILRRNRGKLTGSPPSGRSKREKREFVDWYSAKPFEVVQMDVKYIRDQKALSKQQIIHLDRFAIPNYQWGAIDVNSRFKLIAYSRERSWTNGLCFYLWVISWLRSHGVTAEIVFTVDNGEEFGGKSWLKVKKLRIYPETNMLKVVTPGKAKALIIPFGINKVMLPENSRPGVKTCIIVGVILVAAYVAARRTKLLRLIDCSVITPIMLVTMATECCI